MQSCLVLNARSILLVVRHFSLGVAGALGLLTLVFPGAIRAQDANALLDTVDVHRDVAYAQVDGKSLTLDIYILKQASKPMPVVIWIHGGGWRQGNKDNPMVLPLVNFGFAVVSINYRLSQEAVFPAQIYDCKAAVRWVRAHAADYGFNPDKIGVAGASAGGHLVALLGTTAQHPELEGQEGNPGVSSRVQAVVDFYGPSNFTEMAGPDVSWKNDYALTVVSQLIGGPVAQNEEKARLASPLFYVNAQASPFYIAHGDQDQTVPLQQSIELNDALKKAGVASTLYIVKGGGHGFNDPAALHGLLAFFQQYLQAR